jgi:hypothetical protein
MIVLSVPSALALLPAIFFMGRSEKEKQITVLKNTAAENSRNSVV